MGVMGADNALVARRPRERPASGYAGYFDIDWYPLDEAACRPRAGPGPRRPVRAVLERGELRLAFDADAGEFSVWYHDHRFPIDPREYPRILARRRRNGVAGPLAALLARRRRARAAARRRAVQARPRRHEAAADSRSPPPSRARSRRQRQAPGKPESFDGAARAPRGAGLSARPTGDVASTRSTTAASSTSTTLAACASRTRRCSRRRTAAGIAASATAASRPCASITRTGCSIRRATSTCCRPRGGGDRRRGRRAVYVVAEKILSGANAAARWAGRTARRATTSSTT